MKKALPYHAWSFIQDYQLQAYQVHFWLIKLPKTASTKHLQQLKRERRLILTHILKKYLRESFELIENKSGKPYLKNHELEFNTSHSGQFLAIVISKNPIGMDIEKYKIRKFISFSERFFDKNWCNQHLLPLKGYMQGLRFLQEWSKTEAWVKFLGESIFNYPAIDEKNHHFISFMPRPGLVASLCQSTGIKFIERLELDWSDPKIYNQKIEQYHTHEIQEKFGNAHLQMHWLEEIDSTQNFIKKLKNPTFPCFCFSELQTQGKGRMGRIWQSHKGLNICFSALWRLHCSVQELEGLSLIMGLSVVKTLEKELHIETSVKWPNDIYYQGKKLSGILIELLKHTPQTCDVIIGIGLNVNASQDELPPLATSILEITQKDFDRKYLFKQLICQIYQDLQTFEKKGFSGFLDAWPHYDMLKGKEVSVVQGQKTMKAIAQGVNQKGYLIICDEHHHLREVGSGEASIQSFNNPLKD